MIKGANGESIEEPDDMEKEIAMLAQKLKGVGRPIELVKSPEVVNELFQDTVLKLIEKFGNNGTLFNKLYLDYHFEIYIDDHFENRTTQEFIVNRKLNLSSDLNSITTFYNYNGLNQVGLSNFVFKSRIDIHFNHAGYTISTLDHQLDKLYGTQLTDKEIATLVNAESKRHKAAIEAKIEEVKKNKS